MDTQVIREFAAKYGVSQSELARKSGISRAQINRIFSGKGGEVREATLERLSKALGIDEDANVTPSVIKDYRKVVVEQLGQKSFAGLGLHDFREHPLTAVFEPQRAARHPLASSECSGLSPAERVGRDTCEDASDSFEEARKRSRPEKIIPLIQSSSRTVVLGCPGAGKSTLLQYLAVMLASGKLAEARKKKPKARSQDNDDSVPIYVRLPEFAAAIDGGAELDFIDWIGSRAELFGCPGLAPELRDLAGNHQLKVWFLLDGLDEVPTEDGLRQRVIDIIDGFIRKYPNNRYVVASRLVGFDGELWSQLKFAAFRLVEYDDKQINDTVARWAEVLGGRNEITVDQSRERILSAIAEHPRIRQVAANPLILTILIAVSWSRGYALPRRRVDFFEKVAEVFLDNWEKSKSRTVGYSEVLNVDLDPRELNWLVAELALCMQRAGLVTAKRWFITEHFKQTLCTRIGFDEQEAKESVDTIVQFISHRTGLLEERTPGLFAFSHRAIQEYFAARGLVDESDLDSTPDLTTLIRPHLFDPEWTEVVLLTTAQITPPRAEKIVRLILDDPDESGRFLCRGPIKALRCLADGTTVADRKLTNQLFASLQPLGRSHWLGITMEVFDSLDELVGTRYASRAETAKKQILAEASEHLSEKEVESLEFSAFQASIEPEVEGVGGSITESSVLTVSMQHGNVERVGYLPNVPLFIEDRDQWKRSARELLSGAEVSDDIKQVVVHQIGMDARQNSDAISQLKSLLTKDECSDAVRSTAARMLGSAAVGSSEVQQLLQTILLDTEAPVDVRESCAVALSSSVSDCEEIKVALLSRVDDANEEDDVRAASAWALEDASEDDPVVAERLLSLAINDESRKVVQASVQALESVGDIDQYRNQLVDWALADDFRTRSACSILVTLMTDDRIAWDESLAIRIESVLRRIGTENSPFGFPCPHALSDLRRMVETRERRGGRTVEDFLAAIFAPFAQSIQCAFVFGSVASTDQSLESDLDLMILGDLTTGKIATAIKSAESQIGRIINHKIYALDEFARKAGQQNHFVADVIAKPKLFIEVGDSIASEKELNDELGRLEDKWLAESC